MGSARNLHRDSGVGHSRPHKECHTPPSSKLYINTLSQSLTYPAPVPVNFKSWIMPKADTVLLVQFSKC